MQIKFDVGGDNVNQYITMSININYILYRFKTLNFYNKAYRFGGGVPANISKYKEAARMFKS